MFHFFCKTLVSYAGLSQTFMMKKLFGTIVSSQMQRASSQIFFGSVGYATDYFTLQYIIFESALDKSENVYELKTKYSTASYRERLQK